MKSREFEMLSQIAQNVLERYVTSNEFKLSWSAEVPCFTMLSVSRESMLDHEYIHQYMLQ